MSNTYQALSEVAKATFFDGVFEHDFSPAEEQDWLAAGGLEIVPRTYRVLTDNYTAGAQGELVDLALRVGEEAALVQGGHIERVDKPPAKKAAKATKEKD